MKKMIFSLFLFWAFSPSVWANMPENLNAKSAIVEKEVTSNIRNVTVYQQNAQVNRRAKITIPAGQTQLKFVGLSAQCNSNSIRVKADGKLTVLSVVHQASYYEDPLQTPETQTLNQQIQTLNEKMKKEQVLLEIAQQQERIILANQSMGGTKNELSLVDLQAVTDFYDKKMTALKLEQLEIKLRLATITTDVQKINEQLQELNRKRKKVHSSEVIVTVQAKANTQGIFNLTYLVPNASWSPSYDIKVKDIQHPIDLVYKANIVQNTGEDWDKVRLSLSTGNPSQSSNKPYLNPWQVNLYQHGVTRRQTDYGETLSSINITPTAKEDLNSLPALPLPVQQIENTTSFEYQIDLPYFIPANGKKYMVDIQNYELPATYQYYCVPKMDKDAFLTAQVTGWEAYNLKNGTANLFFEDTYVGQMALNVQQLEDTLSLSLGRDKNIIVHRTTKRESPNKLFSGGKKTDSRIIDIQIRNKKKHPIYIVVKDQFPITVSDDIEIIRERYKKADLEENTGMLTWKLTVPAYQKTEVDFRYAVKYPKKEYVLLE